LVGWLRDEQDWLRRELGPVDRPLRVLDFACGYGFVGALLHHRLGIDDVYAYYASRSWSAGDGRANWASDADWFAAHRLETASAGIETGHGWELAGIDIAANAVAYAHGVGLISRGFTDAIPDDGIGKELASYLPAVDLVIESGAIGDIYRECFGPIVAAAGGSSPWFLYCPRPSVDLRLLDALWTDLGYEVTRASPPVRYRRPIGISERAELLNQTEAVGNDPTTAFVGEHLAVEMRLARPS
jgi:SAM-dependent methyltransferase